VPDDQVSGAMIRDAREEAPSDLPALPDDGAEACGGGSERMPGPVSSGRLRTKVAVDAQRAGISAADIATPPDMPTLFRFPYGTCDLERLKTVAEHGLTAVQWNVV